MKTSLLAFCALALCLALSSCEVLSKNPLSSPTQAVVDNRLVGDWRQSADGDVSQFTARSNGWMHLNVVPTKAGEKIESYDCFVSIIDHNHYLNIVKIQKDESGHLTKAYSLVRYVVTPQNVLWIWPMSQDVAADAVEAGKIKGTVHRNKGAPSTGSPAHPTDVDVTLTDSTTNLARFVHESNVDNLFGGDANPMHLVGPVR